MTDAMNIALSGLNVNTTRLAVSADNVANAATTGRVDDPQSGYQAKDVVATSQAGGGVSATVQARSPSQGPAYAPDDPNANGEGMVNMPNVEISEEVVNQMMAVTGYKANANVVRTLAAMDRALLDIKV